jgi:autotransporter-associated beta strand protein
MQRRKLILAFAVGFLFITSIVQADSGTWLTNPVDNNWNNPANWSSGSVPGDTATLGTSAVTSIGVNEFGGVFEIDFSAGASVYSISFQAPDYFFFSSGGGVSNGSGVMQNFILRAPTGEDNNAGVAIFYFGATAGDLTSYTCEASPKNDGVNVIATVDFQGGTAGSATFHDLGASVEGGASGHTSFEFSDASAENSTIINDGATVNGATGGGTSFTQGKPSAGNATLIANGGSNGGGGGFFEFHDGSLGGMARLEVFGNGYMDMSGRSASSLSIGSIEGDGQIFLSKTTLKVGTNNLSTTFSGVLHPGSSGGGSGTGELTKVGSGTLTLTGANLYTTGTAVNGGTLVVSNTTGSGTGAGPVNVSAGTLGGSGIIAGAVTIGTGSGAGAFLAPAHGGKKQLTLTIQDSLTFNTDATYTYTFKAKGNKSKIDKVIANGVTINSGASFNLSGTAQGTLTQGRVLTVIKNTAATSIAGTFSNLPQGAIVNVNGNNFQASYQGGDGNDLTLTVVP